MQLKSYSNLIRHLPYLDQAFETKKGTWKRYQSQKYFSEFYKKAFSLDSITFSRGDLFNAVEGDFNSAIFSIILWGYPRNMRGNNFSKIFNNENLIVLKNLLNDNKQISHSEFKKILAGIKGTGIGMSTLTKFLYFFRYEIDGYKCLILDQRIISVVNAKTYNDLKIKKISSTNIADRYLEYLKVVSKLAHTNNYLVDQLELFLFLFGRNLKQSA